jgi:hypothetical protein
MARISVDLPAPFGPVTSNPSPSASVKPIVSKIGPEPRSAARS